MRLTRPMMPATSNDSTVFDQNRANHGIRRRHPVAAARQAQCDAHISLVAGSVLLQMDDHAARFVIRKPKFKFPACGAERFALA
jgi:hypothetical protein